METANQKILSGREAANFHEQEILRSSINHLTLATVQIGQSADIQLYSKCLGKTLNRYQIQHQEHIYSQEQTDQKKLFQKLEALYHDESVTGILVFSPLPPNVDWKRIFLNLPLKKDVEGRTFLKHNVLGVFSPTANAVMALLKHHLPMMGSQFQIRGKHAVMVGHSDLVGKPTALLFSDEGATVTVCHKDTKNLSQFVSEADILVVAIGKPGVVQAQWIKPGAVVLDVGENMVNGKVVGDIDFNQAIQRAAYISPVPGGVGPLTNLMVIENLIKLHKHKDSLNGNH